MKTAAIISFACLTLTIVAVRGDDSGLQAILTGAVAHFPGTMALYVKHLKTGAMAAVDGDTPMDSMSVIKLGILVKAYQMAEHGQMRLDDRVVIRPADRRRGSGILQFHASGLKPTIRDLLVDMVITSDNTATDLLLSRVGGVAALNSWFDHVGFPEMRMNMTILDYSRAWLATLDPEARQLSAVELYDLSGGPIISGKPSSKVAAVSKRLDAMSWAEAIARLRPFYLDTDHWLGTITAKVIGRFVEELEEAHLTSAAHSKEIVRILGWQTLGDRRIPHYYNGEHAVAHKTGDGPPMVANDVGIVYLDSGPVVMAILTNDIHGDYGEAEDLEGRLARSIAEYFDGPRK